MSSIERPINKEEDDKFFADMKARIEQNPELLKQPAEPTVDEMVKELRDRIVDVKKEDIIQFVNELFNSSPISNMKIVDNIKEILNDDNHDTADDGVLDFMYNKLKKLSYIIVEKTY